MRNFLATVLSVIAIGVMLIAYGLLSPRAAASDLYPGARDIQDLTLRQPAAYRVNDMGAAPISYATPTYYSTPYASPRRRAAFTERTGRTEPRRVAVSGPKRDWTKTAMVIGGTTAAGAGLGAIFGGKKGALIGAAIGGGAGTLFEVRKR